MKELYLAAQSQAPMKDRAASRSENKHVLNYNHRIPPPMFGIYVKNKGAMYLGVFSAKRCRHEAVSNWSVRQARDCDGKRQICFPKCASQFIEINENTQRVHLTPDLVSLL